MNILFTCAGRRNYLIQYFKEALNGEGKVIATDMQHNAPAMAEADQAFVVPSVYADNYIDKILEVSQQAGIQAIISLNDLELPILSKARERIEALGIRLLVSSDRVIDICFDKWKTIEFLEVNGLKSPKTYLELSEAKVALEKGELSFPIVLKPRWGSASIGIEFPTSFQELELAYELLNVKLKQTILAEASKADIDRSILIQEKINGQEYGVDVINNLEGGYEATIVKQKLAMRAGETDKAMTVDNSDIRQIGKVIGENLAHIGNLDCDIFEKNGEYYVLEMNARFGGGYPFTHMAGGDVPKAVLHWIKNERVSEELLQVTYGKAFSKCDRLIEVPV